MRLYFGVAVIMIVAITVIFIRQSNGASLSTDAVLRHIGCIQGSYPMEILTDDAGEIRKWFEGKMDFSVKLPELSTAEMKPVGARRCHLNGSMSHTKKMSIRFPCSRWIWKA